MKNRYYLIDFGTSPIEFISARTASVLQAGKYTSRDRAMRDLRSSVGDRFAIYDRQDKVLIRKEDA